MKYVRLTRFVTLVLPTADGGGRSRKCETGRPITLPLAVAATVVRSIGRNVFEMQRTVR
jgi:hypothetical protein